MQVVLAVDADASGAAVAENHRRRRRLSPACERTPQVADPAYGGGVQTAGGLPSEVLKATPRSSLSSGGTI